MKSLSELLLQVQNLVVQQPEPLGEELSKLTRDTETFNNSQRWGVYRYAIPARITEAIAKDFVILSKIIGKEKLHQMAADYTSEAQFAPATFEAYAAGFSKFILKSKWQNEMPWASEMADFEFSLYYSSHAESGGSLIGEKQSLLELISPDKLRFCLAPTSALKSFQYDILQAYENESIPEKRETFAIIFSANSEAEYLRLEKVECEALTLIQSGASLLQLLNHFEANETSPDAISQFFMRWTQNGVVADVQVIN